MTGVDSNDRIFLGNAEFKHESAQLLDYVFDQLLELIEQLNEVRQQHLVALFDLCVLAANALVSTCAITKKVDSLVNKMFKMADGYLTEHNKNSTEKLSRSTINLTFENFRKKKEAAGLQLRASVASGSQQLNQQRAQVAA